MLKDRYVVYVHTHKLCENIAYLTIMQYKCIFIKEKYIKGTVIMKMREEFTCPLELVQDMIKGKWKPIILWRLRLGPTPLSKLERDIDGITQKMLLEQLKELMDYGFVQKKTFEGYPLHVEYSLTPDMGMEILDALKIMQHIGIDYLKKNGKEEILIQKGLL